MKNFAVLRSAARIFSGAFALSCLFGGMLQAAPVDSEIVILVDGQSGTQDSFALMLEGVAQAFEQQSFIDSVASGPHRSVAASVMVLNAGGSATAIPWMELSSVEDLQSFATSVRNVTRPLSLDVTSNVRCHLSWNGLDCEFFCGRDPSPNVHC